jgi:hypothetical protein
MTDPYKGDLALQAARVDLNGEVLLFRLWRTLSLRGLFEVDYIGLMLWENGDGKVRICTSTLRNGH